MKKIKYIGIIVLTFFALSINVSTETDNNRANKYMLEASANIDPEPGDCAMNVYKTWEGGWFGTKAKDCWCSTIRKPLQGCSY